MVAIYIHWPFCKAKCPYCDFNSHVRDKIEYERYLHAYMQEISYFSEYLHDKTITSIFFGGGTPSLMPVQIAEQIINKLAKVSNLPAGVEITMEANPTSVEISTFKDFCNAGINRISIGVQSLDDDILKFLGREHNAGEAISAIEHAAKYTNNYSFDLIYATPNQTVDVWKKQLNEALQLSSKHMSLYQLTIEKGTPFYAAYNKGEFKLPCEDTQLDLYNATNEIAAQHGLSPYEISNYASEGYECRHNLSYWHYDEYLGIGAGAHSRIRMGDNNLLHAVMMTHSPEKWLKRVEEVGCGIQSEIALLYNDILSESMLMGLRISNGISRERFAKLFKKQPEDIFEESMLLELCNQNLMILDNKGMRLTPRGRNVINNIVYRLC
jgi:oxygen-independent coproporphyrinogen-3 oxidase